MKINSYSFTLEKFNTKQKPGLFYGPAKRLEEDKVQEAIKDFVNKKLAKNNEIYLFHNVKTITEIKSKRMKNARGDVTHTNEVIITLYTQEAQLAE